MPNTTATDAMILQAMDWLFQFYNRWKGYLVSATQPLAFPREGIDYIGPGGNPLYYPADEIPANLVEAQKQLVLAIQSGVLVVGGTAPGLAVVKEKVGPLETE